jgi:4-diphosphocytidyl-2-C-methyl-D-erythritol kinase
VKTATNAHIRIRAHAKINLDLRVLGSRADGFHEVRTVFQAISLHDTLTVVSRSGPFAIESATPGFPLDSSNLIWKAAQLLWRAIRRTGDVRDAVVRVDKQIPLQAGLGGGSGNAAAALIALARAWHVNVRPSQLMDLAAALGADVPFFLAGGTALGLGRGEEIYPLADLPRHWIILLIPGFGISTADAYDWYDSERDLYRGMVREPQHVPGPWPSRAAQMINDLEPPIARRYPEIEQMKAALRRVGALAAAMSGSGSAVFGLFQRRAEATAALDRLAGLGWRVLLTESLGRGEYARRSKPVIVRSTVTAGVISRAKTARPLARKPRID